MDNIIKKIKEVLGNNPANQIHIHIAPNEIWMEIYETEVPITIDLKKKRVYFDCSICSNCCLTYDMLLKLSQIMKILEDNIDKLNELVKVE